MNSDRPKQFLILGGIPVMEHSIRAFCSIDEGLRGGMVLVSHKDYQKQALAIAQKHKGNLGFLEITEGGSTRHASTRKGIAALKSRVSAEDIIMIHDGARPMLTSQEIESLFFRLQEDPAAMCATLAAPATETYAMANSMKEPISEVPDRSRLFAIKTPQAMRGNLIESFLKSKEDHYTDLISWSLSQKLASVLVPASEKNIKLTRPGDLTLMESLLSPDERKGL